ncbi:MAG: hypothetical protein JW969_11305 [Spirochaetales bacterium]|nr:hypothetical protein [Spirochaetales bacterium]
MRKLPLLFILLITITAPLFAFDVVQDWIRLKQSCHGLYLYLDRNDSYTFYFYPQSLEKQVIIAQTLNFNTDVDLYIYDAAGNQVYSASNLGNETVYIEPASIEDKFYVKVFMRSGQDKVRVLAGEYYDVTSYRMLFD